MYLDDLLSLVPSDTEDLVERARERANQMVRDVLRQETALRLRRPENDEQITVRIRTKPGLPVSLQQKQIDEKDRIAALIAPFRRSLTSLKDAGADMVKLVHVLDRTPRGSCLVEGGREHLEAVMAFAELLLRESAAFNLAR